MYNTFPPPCSYILTSSYTNVNSIVQIYVQSFNMLKHHSPDSAIKIYP